MMTDTYEAIKISDRVYWVGAVDWDLRDFHGYLTSRGSTYNAYLVMADKVTLIDAVKTTFVEEMFARIASVVPLEKIHTVVSNHAEMDHSGGLPQVFARCRPEEVFASPMGVKALQSHFHWHHDLSTVKTGDTLDLGGAHLKFIETRMLHWPDSMFSYLEEEGLLFSNDAFGMHLATAERFADEIDEAILREEAAKYFANIVLPFAPVVTKLVNQLPSLNLDLKMIAPDHGPVWRERPEEIIARYAAWAPSWSTTQSGVARRKWPARSVKDSLPMGARPD
jgi:flavorubredoxin